MAKIKKETVKKIVVNRDKAVIDEIYKTIKDLTKRVAIYASQLTTLRNKFEAHINEPTATIAIKEESGEWGDWTGIFHLEPEEKLDFLLAKVEAHFEKHFSENNKGKEFAIIKTFNGERVIHKIIQLF